MSGLWEVGYGLEHNCSGVSQIGWLGTLQIGIIDSGSNIGLLWARTSVNREYLSSQILYIWENLEENGGNI
jgi:hypothetical protein